jgi:hypothetical protein
LTFPKWRDQRWPDLFGSGKLSGERSGADFAEAKSPDEALASDWGDRKSPGDAISTDLGARARRDDTFFRVLHFL